MKFSEGAPPDLVQQMIMKICVDHPERYLLAFVYGHIGQNDLLRVRTDAEKYLPMACLNLVAGVLYYIGAHLRSPITGVHGIKAKHIFSLQKKRKSAVLKQKSFDRCSAPRDNDPGSSRRPVG